MSLSMIHDRDSSIVLERPKPVKFKNNFCPSNEGGSNNYVTIGRPWMQLESWISSYKTKYANL